MTTWVAVGNGPKVSRSTDGGVSWALESSPASANLRDVDHDGVGLFVAVGLSGNVMTSPDGITWTARTYGVSASVAAVTYGSGPGLWAATAGGTGNDFDTIRTSPDGITWTARTSNAGTSTIAIGGLAYGNGKYIACYHGGKISTSTDGITWTVQTGFGNDIRGAVWTGTNWVIVGGAGLIKYSPTGNDATWTDATGQGSTTFESVGYDGTGRLCAGRQDGDIYYSDDDGVTWTLGSTVPTAAVYQLRFAGGNWVAVGASGQVHTSLDGITWTARTGAHGTDTIYGLAGIAITVVGSAHRAVYAIRIGSAHRAVYALRIGLAHRGVYAIRIGHTHRAVYQSLSPVASQHRAVYALQSFDRTISQHRARYAIKVALMHRARYQSLVPVASMHRAVYGLLNRTISQHRARYAILDYDRLVSQHRAIYGLIGFVPVVSSGTITATVAGKTVPLASVTIHADEDSPFWQAQISLHNPADYSRFPVDRAITVNLYGTVYALVVDTRSQPRAMDEQGNPTIEAQITALSPGAAYAFPRATPLTKTWTTPIYARAAVEEVLAQSVEWAILNWQIPAYRLAANESAPLDIARQIVEAAGAVLESKPDGSFRVRYRHPVAAPLYRSAATDYSIDEHEIYSVNDQGARARLINRLRLADLETVFQDRLEFVANPDDPQRGTIRAYLSPWRTTVRLRSTRNRPPVYVYRGVVRSRTETEAVEFREGRASVQYPVTAINAVDWLDDSLGGVAFAAGSADLTVSGDGWSYAEITYTTRAIEYPVYGKVDPGEELAAQFLLEDI